MENQQRLLNKTFSAKNLLKAFQKASKNKRLRAEVLEFEKDLGKNLLAIQSRIGDKTYRHGRYHFFTVRDTKERRISAAPFADRIVHHAIYRAIYPVFEKSFIFDSFANRKEKGTHKAIGRLSRFLTEARRHNPDKKLYCLKCDIAKCFPSINHEILLKMIGEKIKDAETLWLIGEIVGSFETGNEFDHLFQPDSPFLSKRPRGIPIGNLTSQLFVNIYLDPLDKWLKHKEKTKWFIRYVDDFVILHPDKRYLHGLKEKIRGFLREKLFLELHPKKQSIFPVDQGIDFLGYVVFQNHRFLRKSNKQKFKKNLKKLKKLCLAGRLSGDKAAASITSWLAHASHADSYRLRRRIFGKPLGPENQKEIRKFVKRWNEDGDWPVCKPSGQLRLF